MKPDRPVLEVDFNEMDESGHLTSLDHAEVGTTVWLQDGDGSGCLGVVVDVFTSRFGGGLLTSCRPDFTTWQDG